MARLIDADNLAEYKFASDKIIPTEWQQGWNDALDTVINEVPTVDVVQCKDCKHYWKNTRESDEVIVCLASAKDDAFCSEGERREDADIS